ncbi:MAG TPA: hypothetical protein VFZ78_02320 [Flavisolibacter sp.]
MPVSYLHDLVADHKDAVLCDHPVQATHCVHQQDYHCDIHKLVVSSVYCYDIPVYSFELAGDGGLITSDRIPQADFAFVKAEESRGPPVL